MSDALNDPETYDPQCPCCGQGGLQPAYLRPFGERPFWICEECDALWDQPHTPNSDNVSNQVSFSTFMEERGYSGDWHLVIPREV